MVRLIIDKLVSLTALIILLPIIVVVAVLVYLKLGKPVLFTQIRPGLHGKQFKLYKFRTMKDAVDSHGVSLPDSERLTRFGQLLRSTSLDELPTLSNVLIGDMSLIGPRPLLVEYLELYSDEQARRHLVKPGITGWAQVNGRNTVSWDEKFKLDVWYVDNRSLSLDLKIIYLTLKKVVMREDISAPGHVTIDRFRGNG